MSKIICDVCGTSYPDTAEQCPICGCSRDAAADLLKDDLLLDGEPEGGQSGGRMSDGGAESFRLEENEMAILRDMTAGSHP